MKPDYYIYLGLMILVFFMGYKLIKGEKSTEPDYAAAPKWSNPFV